MNQELFHTDDDFRDHLSTVSENGKRLWVYPRIIKGKFFKLRSVFAWILLALMFGLPFVEVDNHPFFLFNVIERKFIFWGVTFFPQDFHLVAIGLIIFIVFIILFTVIFGRVWCGWACPQTIFMEMVFRKIENWIEGDYRAQKRLDASPWTSEKIRKKTLKHSLFFLISFLIANIFLAYIIGKNELLRIITDNPANHIAGLSSILIFTGTFYYVFARFRENVCTVVCPYGRLQAALMDKKSMIVAYDYQRGEPRGKVQKNTESPLNQDKGDCIDCALCVHVCPTAIDIRNGSQMECIGCTACIDACDMVMDKIQKPRGLISYNSTEGIENKKKFRFTGRIAAYSGVLLVLTGIMIFLLLTRGNTETTILRTPGLTYQQEKDGSISNLYNLQILNKTSQNLSVTLRIKDFPAAKVKMVGTDHVQILANDLATASFFIAIPNDKIEAGNLKLQVEVVSEGKVIDAKKTSFLGPVK